MNELRAAWRRLVTHKASSGLAILTLGLGLGASASLFSLLDALYFRPLPLREAERLVLVSRPSPRSVFGLFSHAEVEEMATALPAASRVVAVGGRGVTLRAGGESRMLIVQYVSPGFFEALGVPLALGRGLEQADAQGTAPLVVVNHQLWRDVLGSPPLGAGVQLNDALFTLVGVTAPEFLGLDRTRRSDVFVLTAHARFAVGGLADEVADRDSRWFEAWAQLAPGATIEALRTQAAALSQRWAADDPRTYAGSALVVESFAGSQRATAGHGLAFLGLVGLVLAIAAANATHLALARSEQRRTEWAVRAALGASGGRLARAIVVENALLMLPSLALGLAFAAAAMQAFQALVPPSAVPIVLDTRFDVRLLGFTTTAALATAVLVALVPAWRHRRPALADDLRLGRVAGATRRWSTADLLVAAQMAIGTVVVVAAVLLGRALERSAAIPAGFAPDQRLATFYVVPGLRGLDPAATWRYLERARERLLALPGVVRTSYTIRLPAQGNEAGWATSVVVPGQDPPPGEEAFRIRFGIVGPDYFEAVGARLLAGRGFAAVDGPEATPVAVVNRSFAQRMWPDRDAVGQSILTGASRTPRVVVGVVEDGRIADLHEPPEPYLFVPFAQQPQGFALLLVETAGEPESVFAPTRAALAELAPEVGVLAASTLARHRELVLFEERRDAWIAAVSAGLGLLLGAVGLYGVVALATLRRMREFGVRLALGAPRAHLLRLVLGRGLRLAGGGAALGLAASLGLGGVLQSRLHGVAATDPLAFAAGALVLLLAALAASAWPAIRATRADPLVAIRAE
jgi:predicted permease